MKIHWILILLLGGLLFESSDSLEKKGAELRYHIISVPDNSLPRWIVDPIVRKNLWTSMERLKLTIESL